jgi:putative membrane protein
MLLDAALSVAHFVLLAGLLMALAAEAALLKPGLAGEGLGLMARLDAAYGLAALGLVAAGTLRVLFGAIPSEVYTGNPVFWAKIALIALMAAVSLPPTIAFQRWRRAARADPAFAVGAAEVARIRPFLIVQIVMTPVIIVAAAMMARGMGL